MPTHDAYQDLMVEALFDEIAPEDRRRLEAHLRTCEACASEFNTLQATLSVTEHRERPELPPSYWTAYSTRLHQRIATETAETPLGTFVPLSDALQHRWRQFVNAVQAALPSTGLQWVFQGAIVTAVLLLGIALGDRAPTSPSGPDSAPLLLGDPGDTHRLSDLMLAEQSVESPLGTARPALAGVEDIVYNVSDGTVEIRYRTVNHITLKGNPDNPKIQRLLRAALLDDTNPASRLHTVKAVDAAPMRPDPEVVRALTYLAQEDEQPHMRLRAVQALRTLHQDRPMGATVRNVLIQILLESDREALRIEAMEALTARDSEPDTIPGYLYQVRNDSNSYVRYRAQEHFRTVDSRP